VVAVSRALSTAGRTPLARLEQVNCFDANPGLFGFVSDELLQLVEVPRVDATPVATVTNPLQVLNF